MLIDACKLKKSQYQFLEPMGISIFGSAVVKTPTGSNFLQKHGSLFNAGKYTEIYLIINSYIYILKDWSCYEDI